MEVLSKIVLNVGFLFLMISIFWSKFKNLKMLKKRFSVFLSLGICMNEKWGRKRNFYNFVNFFFVFFWTFQNAFSLNNVERICHLQGEHQQADIKIIQIDNLTN